MAEADVRRCSGTDIQAGQERPDAVTDWYDNNTVSFISRSLRYNGSRNHFGILVLFAEVLFCQGSLNISPGAPNSFP